MRIVEWSQARYNNKICAFVDYVFAAINENLISRVTALYSYPLKLLTNITLIHRPYH